MVTCLVLPRKQNHTLDASSQVADDMGEKKSWRGLRYGKNCLWKGIDVTFK